MYAWDVGARRSAGAGRPASARCVATPCRCSAAMVILPVLVYTASWTGWFATGDGYDRHDLGRSGVVGTLENWVDYHKAALCYHEGLTNTPTKKDHFLCGVDESQCTTATQYDKPLNTYCYSNQSYHPYESKPFGWLVLARPVAYAYDTRAEGHQHPGPEMHLDDRGLLARDPGRQHPDPLVGGAALRRRVHVPVGRATRLAGGVRAGRRRGRLLPLAAEHAAGDVPVLLTADAALRRARSGSGHRQGA